MGLITHQQRHRLPPGMLLLPLLPLLLAACGGGSGTAKVSATSHLTPNATAATPQPPAVKGVYLNTYDESTATGQTAVSDQALVALNPADGSVRWTIQKDLRVLVATDRIVYAASDKGVVALRASDGSQLWSHAGGAYADAFAYGSGIAYALLCDGTSGAACTLSALDGLTGATRWTSQVAQGGKLTLVGSDILVASVTPGSNGAPISASLSVLDAGTGKLLWNVAAQGKGFRLLAWHGDQLYLSQDSGTLPETHQLQAVRLADGSQFWESGNIQTPDAALGVDSAHIYIEFPAGVQAINEADGSIAWTFTSDLGAGASVLANGIIYSPLYSGQIVAVDGATGQTLNSAPFPHVQGSLSLPVIANGLIYLNSQSADGNHTPSFSALDTTANFAQRWTYQGAFDTPVISNGVLFDTSVTSITAPSVYAFSATSGALLWKYDVGHMVTHNADSVSLTVVD